ncbi:ABC-2 type transporter-domain-containing protein [Tricladium varicosporioides]|nr:ABC-2 type transporter-domain-containing protein [Hymenoscyphus varicosporioides]
MTSRPKKPTTPGEAGAEHGNLITRFLTGPLLLARKFRAQTLTMMLTITLTIISKTEFTGLSSRQPEEKTVTATATATAHKTQENSGLLTPNNLTPEFTNPEEARVASRDFSLNLLGLSHTFDTKAMATRESIYCRDNRARDLTRAPHILVLYEGKEMYYGPLKVAKSFMEDPLSIHSSVASFFQNMSFALYHPAAFRLSQIIIELSIHMFQVSFFSLIIYFMAELTVSAGTFCTLWFIGFATAMYMTALFRAVDGEFPTLNVASKLSGFLVSSLIMCSGYMTPKSDMHPRFDSIFRVDPLAYAYNALLSNEFHDKDRPCVSPNLVPNRPGYGFALNQAAQQYEVFRETPQASLVRRIWKVSVTTTCICGEMLESFGSSGSSCS